MEQSSQLLPQFSVDSTTLLVVLVLNVVLVGVLLAVITRQNKQIADLNEANRPKYGFLGKPLYSAMLMIVLVGGFGSTYFFSQSQDVSTSDTSDTLELQVTTSRQGSGELKLNVVPVVNGTPWGAASSRFDAFWTVTGDSGTTSDFELSISKDKPGGIRFKLSSGVYQIRVDVVYEDQTWSKTISFTM